MSKRLDRIHIPSPCPVSWDEMKGDDKRRHCSQCDCTVYDISAMTTAEGERVLDRASEGLCVQVTRGTDGSVVATDSPARIKRRTFGLQFLFLLGWMTGGAVGCREDREVRRTGGSIAPSHDRTGGKVAPIEMEKPRPMT